jgi:death-on-curing protein
VTRFLTLEDALAVAEAYLHRRPDVRDYGLLDSALMRPQASAFGQDAYPDFDRQAAALLLSLVGNHALADGNKRLGWVCTRLFYILNGRDLRAPEDDAYDLVGAIASHEPTGVEKVAAVPADRVA